MPNSSLPLVSVCMGAYNRKDFIREAVDSALAQTYPALEVVVVENQSTDGTLAVLESYGDRIRLIRRERHATECAVSRNQAGQHARGTYIAFLDSDDVWYPEKIEKQVQFMEAHPDIPLCHTYCRVIDDQSQPVGIRHEGMLPPTGRCFEALLEHCWITISSVMARRTLFDELGWFSEQGLFAHCGDDYEFFMRVAARHPVGLLDEVLAGYRKGAQNLTRGRWRQTPEAVPFHRHLIDRPDIWKGLVPREVVVEAFIRRALDNALFWREHGEAGRSLWFLGQALRFRPVHAQLWMEMAKSVGRAVWPVTR